MRVGPGVVAKLVALAEVLDNDDELVVEIQELDGDVGEGCVEPGVEVCRGSQGPRGCEGQLCPDLVVRERGRSGWFDTPYVSGWKWAYLAKMGV